MELEDVDFNLFWAAYPRKTAKQVARKRWAALAPAHALVAKMIVAIGRQKESEQWKRGVIPHASTWLNQRRWEDEMEPASPLSKQGQETMANLADWLRPHSVRIDAARLDP